MDENVRQGEFCFIHDVDNSRNWFCEQWARWPERVDERYTTNLSFMYGGILGYRKTFNSNPVVSSSLQASVDFLDKYSKNQTDV